MLMTDNTPLGPKAVSHMASNSLRYSIRKSPTIGIFLRTPLFCIYVFNSYVYSIWCLQMYLFLLWFLTKGKVIEPWVSWRFLRSHLDLGNYLRGFIETAENASEGSAVLFWNRWIGFRCHIETTKSKHFKWLLQRVRSHIRIGYSL
jgi:hypothetical protein